MGDGVLSCGVLVNAWRYCDSQLVCARVGIMPRQVGRGERTGPSPCVFPMHHITTSYSPQSLSHRIALDSSACVGTGRWRRSHPSQRVWRCSESESGQRMEVQHIPSIHPSQLGWRFSPRNGGVGHPSQRELRLYQGAWIELKCTRLPILAVP
jgi:hypothetical protein